MNRNEELEQLKNEYQNINIPKEGIPKMEEAIRRAKMDKKRDRRKKLIRNWGIGVAAAFVLVVLPNTNESIAYAMGKLPVVGEFFQVITIREYSHDDGHNVAKVEVPQIVAGDTETPENSEAVNKINQSVEEYTNELIAEFETDMQEEGFKELDISYDVVTDTDSWFTLKITGLEVQASGFEFYRYYHIDRTNGRIAELKDMFTEGADYITPISDEIKKQMREQMDAGTNIYFMEDDELADGFVSIAENQNFYLDKEGNIVIAFDEYEVAPGSSGSPEFKIPAEVLAGIRK